jgi:hypothetical protein
MGFTGWTLFGQFTTAARIQAVIVLVNQFFNPITVAAIAVSRNIAGNIQMFSNNFNSSLYPPIIKSYASNNHKNMFSLIYSGSKITFFLMWIFALPFIIEMETILGLWLKSVPKGTILFTRLALVEVLINSISMPIQTAARAPGKMKAYELILGSIQIGVFFVSWLMLNLGYEVHVIFLIAIVANIIMFLIRLLIVRYLVSLSFREFIYKVMLPIVNVVLVSILISFLFKYYIFSKGILNSFFSILVSGISVVVSVYYLGLDKEWKNKLKLMICNRLGIQL